MLTCLSALRNESFTINTSFSNVSFHEDLQSLKLVAYGYVGACIVFIGILGNSLTIITVVRLSRQEVTYIYLACLAISDLLTLVFGMSSLIRLQDAQPTSWLSAVYFSHVELPVVNAFMASSVFLVVCLTFVRYFSVCHPTRFGVVRNRKCTIQTIICVYTTAFIVYIPVGFEKFLVSLDSQYLSCENSAIVNSTVYQTYLLVKECLVRLGPVLMLVFLNLSIIYGFSRRRRKMSMRYSSTSSFRRKIRTERRLVVLLGAIVVIFCVCVTPASVLTLLYSEEKDHHFGFQVFRAVANLLELANHAINFYVYCLCSPDIRSGFLKLFVKKV